MAKLRSTVVVKTDICEFTPRLRSLAEDELSKLLSEHKRLINEIAVRNEGVVIKGEGDAFWIVFPSVTGAALAAVEMQQELRLRQAGISDEKRISIRIVIALGDALHHDEDIFGDVVNLTSRIEDITPKDEIYLSQAAWLALNKAEIQSSYVNEFQFKGISEPAKVYRIEQKYRTRTVKDQTIVITDLTRFLHFYSNNPLEASENLLIKHDEMIKEICDRYGGVIRQLLGDGHIITFSDTQNALTAVVKAYRQWEAYAKKNGIPCKMKVGVHRGTINIFRGRLYGDDINRANTIATTMISKPFDVLIFLSREVWEEVQSTEWDKRIKYLEQDIYSFIGSKL